MATPQMTAKIATQMVAATRSRSNTLGKQCCQQRHAGVNQQDVGDRDVGKSNNKRSRGGGKQILTRRLSKLISWNSLKVPRGPVALDHEGEQEGYCPERAPEHNCPAISHLDEAGDGAAEAPHHHRHEHQKNTKTLIAPRDWWGNDVR